MPQQASVSQLHQGVVLAIAARQANPSNIKFAPARTKRSCDFQRKVLAELESITALYEQVQSETVNEAIRVA